MSFELEVQEFVSQQIREVETSFGQEAFLTSELSLQPTAKTFIHKMSCAKNKRCPLTILTGSIHSRANQRLGNMELGT